MSAGICQPRLTNDINHWISRDQQRYLDWPQNARALSRLRSLCNSSDDIQQSLYVKVAVDGVIFNHDYGLNVLHGKIGSHLMYDLRNISISMLLARFYGTDAQKTYWAMDFPESLLGSLNRTRNGHAHDQRDPLRPNQKFQCYVVHRETVYGLAAFFDWDIQIGKLPPGEVPVSTSFLFMLHRHRSGEYYVKILLWTPYDGTYVMRTKGCSSPHLCTLDELIAVYQRRIDRTGDWRKLCGFSEPKNDLAKVYP
jgi:hypothetical protein